MPVQGLRTALPPTFQTIREWARLGQGGRRKRQKKKILKLTRTFHEHFVPLPTCTSFYLIPHYFKLFSPKSRLVNAKQKEKKMGQDRLKRKGEAKAKSESPDYCVTFKLKTLRNFCFYVCLNFWSLYFAPGTEDREVLDLWSVWFRAF